MHDFLVEIQTEELPPKMLQRLAQNFLDDIKNRLMQMALPFKEGIYFATPRRLAVLITQLSSKQPDTVIERKGPALKAAYDADGNPTPACLGFARTCGVPPEKLITLKTPQGEWVGFRQKVKGKMVENLLGDLVNQALSALPIAKRMRWNSGDIEFVRPVHSVILLYNNKIIPAELFGLKASNKTHAHRFMSKGWVSIKTPTIYAKTMEKHYVLVDFEKRKEKIRNEAIKAVKKIPNADVLMDETLLNEVTGLVEWPVAICGQFDKRFLQVPQEVLISAMQDHQRYFPVVDKQKKLLPYFVAISNIKSNQIKNIIHGNERVLRARLDDAAFFFETDKKQKLIDRVNDLKNILFQQKLGTLFDKSERLAHLAFDIAEAIGTSAIKAKRAGLLAKTDLTTQLVGEFPELQGIAGFYYAKYEGIPQDIAIALFEQYLPRFSGDKLPGSPIGSVIALADRLDTLVGAFGIHQPPTGDKDPLGLRRACLGVLRILIEKSFNLDLKKLLELTSQGLSNHLENKNVVGDVLQFMLERLKFWYQEQQIPPDVFASVAALNITSPYDFHCRIQAVTAFKKRPEAQSLSIANKRVSHILLKYPERILISAINANLFEQDIEKKLADILIEKREKIILLSKSSKYTDVLTHLADLKDPVDIFFDKVLVMTDDKARRENRLLLLKQLRELFLQVADIALLQ